MGKRRKASGLRKIIRGLYRTLGIVNTATYVLGAGANPGKLAKHLTRKRTSKLGSRIVR
jgi:hypothetical protein